jgi:nucleoside 2-deoxyribosyltransferase
MPPDRQRCYVASPLGFSDAGRRYYAEVYLPALREVIEPVDPWSLVTEAEIADARAGGSETELAREIGRKNAEAIRSCQLLAAFLDGQEVDSGTAAEVGYAAALGLRCFGLRSDFRQTGEAGATVNLQLEWFVIASGGRIVGSLDELVHDLASATASVSR